jgi:hypothetical protein
MRSTQKKGGEYFSGGEVKKRIELPLFCDPFIYT